jgi:hypothetical protein
MALAEDEAVWLVLAGRDEKALIVMLLELMSWVPHFPKPAWQPVWQWSTLFPQYPYCEQHSLRPAGPTKPMQVMPLAPQLPSVVVGPVGVGTGPVALAETEAEAEGEALGWAPHFPKPAWQPVWQWSAEFPHQPYCEQHSLRRPSRPTKPTQDWSAPVAPHEPSLEVGPVGVAVGTDEEVRVEEVPGGAGVESRYQFSLGSCRHSPIVTAFKP